MDWGHPFGGEPAPDTQAAPDAPAGEPFPDVCPAGPDGVHQVVAEVTGTDRVRTSWQRCLACGHKVVTGTQEV